MEDILIYGGRIVNRGSSFEGYLLVSGGRIAAAGRGAVPAPLADSFTGRKIDAAGMLVMPGVIDDQVHFREPGMEYKGDIGSESIAAVAGGVTSYMEMPNTRPPATTLELLGQKFSRAAETSAANYSFYLGATNDNIREIERVDPKHVCGLKLFMGSSTGNMLVDDNKALSTIFESSPVIIATHCEDETIIRENNASFRSRFGDGATPDMHPLIRSAEACYRSSARAVELADRYGADLHVLHLSTGRELSLFDTKPLADKKITNEVCVHHLWFTDEDYKTRGNFIKWNPAVKTRGDRDALRMGLLCGKVDMIATDHAPHSLEEKQRPYWECPSGGPSVQHSLPAMLELASQGVLSIEQVVDKMCHAPAIRFRIKGRGFLDTGFHADIAIVDPQAGWTVGGGNILYKCGWSPFEGVRFGARVEYTIINGRVVNDRGVIDTAFRGMPLEFDR